MLVCQGYQKKLNNEPDIQKVFPEYDEIKFKSLATGKYKI